jgi:uncharacterized protein with ParB-like and HNH nuclease domain
MVSTMNFKISQAYFDTLVEKDVPSEFLNKLNLLINKEYSDISGYQDDLNLVFENDFDDYKTIAIESLILESDNDTRNEETFANGTIYPYDPSKADIDIREEPQTIFELVIRKWEQEKLIIDPEFQRNFVWKPEQQSLFIESVILNFPLPPLYINKDAKGKYIVVDGRQRITTLRRFLKDEFRLNNLRALPQLNNKNFSELIRLNPEYQTKIEDKKLLVYLIQPTVPLEMVYDIFNRINTGGTQLERQEIRDCIFMGVSTKLLARLASKDYFIRAIDWGISPNRKKDQEAVLRYIAFKVQNYENDYKGSINDFVEDVMRKINKGFSKEQIIKIEEDFERVMKTTYSFFKSQNFRIPTENTRGRVNLAVLESVSYFFSNQSDEFLKHNKEKIKENFKRLLNNERYLDSVRIATGDTQRVITRFKLAQEILSEV